MHISTQKQTDASIKIADGFLSSIKAEKRAVASNKDIRKKRLKILEEKTAIQELEEGIA